MNVQGFLTIAMLLGWLPLCGFIGHWVSRHDRRKLVDVAIADLDQTDPVAPTPIHLHILDLDRSDVTVTDAGAVLASCIVAGCEERVYISPNLARLYVRETAEVRA